LLAYFRWGGSASLGVEPGVAKDHGMALENFNQPAGSGDVGVRGCPGSDDDLPQDC